MKIPLLLICLAALTTSPLFGQETTTKTEPQVVRAPRPNPVQPPQSNLTKFDLDFPGGTPGELVAAIQKAMGRPLNAIVKAEYANRKLPPLKMNQVDVAQLFKGLEFGSHSTAYTMMGGASYAQSQSVYGFRTLDSNNPGALTDDTIWAFFEQGTDRLPSVSRFYLLTPYLDGGLTVDDITTAIQTGWRLQGNVEPPKLSFHKETKLLIAVGNQSDLDTVDAVLKALDALRANTSTEKSAATEAKTKP